MFKKTVQIVALLMCSLTLTACDTIGGSFVGNNNGASLGLGSAFTF